MSAIQQTDKIAFGTGRLFVTPTGGGARLFYGDLTEADVEISVDLKEAFGEAGFPISVADGHRSLMVSAKHYTLRLDALANDLGVSAPTSSADSFSWDEAGIVPGTPYQYTLANAAAYITGTLVLKVFLPPKNAPVYYAIVANGSEVAGKSASVTAGVLKFAAGDSGVAFQATYQYSNTAGQRIQIVNTFQGSSLPYTMVLAKRDVSPIDNTIGQLIFTLNAVRFGGFKSAYKEGDYTVYERSFKAFADPTGVVGYVEFVNTTTNNAA
jgi:hypothetical protein